MKIHSSLSLACAALASASLAVSAHAATIYADDFSGAAGTDLNGSAPDVRPGTETWSANSFFDFSGSNTVTSTTDTNVHGAYLPFTPQTGFIYTLKVTMAFAAAPDSNTHSLQVGFLESAPGTGTNGLAVASGSGDAVFFLRGTGTYEARADGGVAGTSGSISGSTVANPHVVQIMLDTSQTKWVFRAFLDGTEIGSAQTYTTNPSLLAVGFSTNTSSSIGAVGDFSDFSLTSQAIPEPSGALLGVGSLAGLFIRRRRSA